MNEEEPYTNPMFYWIKVTKVDGGYLLQTSDTAEVVPEPEEPKHDWGDAGYFGGDGRKQEATIRMLYHVLDFFGQSGSKHDARRIRIIAEKQ